MSVHQIAQTTEEQLEQERLMMAHFNQCVEQAGWGVRLEPLGSPTAGGVKIVETRPRGYTEAKTLAEQRRGEWFAGVFELLWMTGESERVHPQMFEAQAQRHWEERLRKNAAGRDFADLADARDRAIYLQHNQRKEWARDIGRRAKDLDNHIVAHGIDSFVPPHWPTRDGIRPIERPHIPRNEIVVGKDGKPGYLLTVPAVQHQIWLHRGWWQFLEWAGHQVDLTPTLRLLYLARGKLLLPPRLQQLLKRWRRLRIETGDNSNLPANPSPFPGRRKSALWAGAEDLLEKHEDNGQSGTNDRDGEDQPGDV
jgi:hypothetical protein